MRNQRRKASSCGTCHFFELGDPSPKEIGNVGICTFMLVRKKNFYAHSTHVPLWAENTVHRVSVWSNENCPTYRRAH